MEKYLDKESLYCEESSVGGIVYKFHHPTKYFNSFIEYLLFIVDNINLLGEIIINSYFPGDISDNMIIAYIHPGSVYNKSQLRTLFKSIFGVEITEMDYDYTVNGNISRLDRYGIRQNTVEWCEVDNMFPPIFAYIEGLYYNSNNLSNMTKTFDYAT